MFTKSSVVSKTADKYSLPASSSRQLIRKLMMVEAGPEVNQVTSNQQLAAGSQPALERGWNTS